MPILLEPDGRGPSRTQLLLYGVGVTLVTALLLTGLYIKMDGGFDNNVEVTASLTDIGDGLPDRSDVKFRGVLVGEVAGVTPSRHGGANTVHIRLKPAHAAGISSTVTARVVPSNVFAVSSVELVDNGTGPPLRPHAEILQDRSLSTIQLQTALTTLREILAATARLGTDDTVGVLATMAAATDQRGDDIVTAGAQLQDIAHELGAIIGPNELPGTIDALGGALHSLQESTPELLEAINHSIQPMRTLAESDAALGNLLSAGVGTMSNVKSVLGNNTDRLITVTTQLSPVIGVFADGSPSFTPIVNTMRDISGKWFSEFWPEGQLNGTGKFIFQVTPHRLYTRADCPRYGDLAGPSCATAPEAATETPGYGSATPPQMSGGNVGPVGSPQEKEALAQILDGDLSIADELLLGPLARGNNVQLAPNTDAVPE